MKYLRLKNNTKVPLVAGAFDGESDDLIKEHLANNGNIGLLTGSASSVAVIDIDMHHNINGLENLKTFLETYDIVLPKTKVVKTPSGGYHYYFRFPKELHDKRFIQNHKDLQGVDFQTSGRYVVAPPSQINGTSYNVVRDMELVDLPEKWLDMFEDKSTTTKNKKRERKFTANLLGDIISGCEEGSRNIFLTSIIGKLFATGLEHEEVRVWSIYVNQISLNPPLSEEEVLRTYESVRKREIRRMEND